jgi:hypothetical protein
LDGRFNVAAWRWPCVTHAPTTHQLRAVVTRSSLFRVRQEMMRRAHRVPPRVELNSRTVGMWMWMWTAESPLGTRPGGYTWRRGAGLRAGAGRRKAARRGHARRVAGPGSRACAARCRSTDPYRTHPRHAPLQGSLRMVGGTWDAACAGTTRRSSRATRIGLAKKSIRDR